MTARGFSAALLAALAFASASASHAASAVFNGDPIDPATSLPYEILPGMPLVGPGPDGRLGTPDDVVDQGIIGDIDVVVRSGSPIAGAALPPPAAAGDRASLPVGVAGSPVGGGTAVPFTAFLSDGVTDATAPSGHPIASPDLDGLPVIVIAFADLDGDGFIGLTRTSGATDATDARQVRELEPVGRGVALWSGGVAHGSVAIRAGLPASRGGLTIALAAVALTGPLDPGFFGGAIPSGPAISTALPFLPQRDLTRLIRDRAVPFGPTTTLQDVVQLAALPVPGGPRYALPLDGSSPTIDTAVVRSQAAVRVAFRDDDGAPLSDLLLGMKKPANDRALRAVPVDRWGNPADPAPGFTVKLRAEKPLKLVGRAVAKAAKGIAIPDSNGLALTLRGPGGKKFEGATAALVAESQGAVLGALPVRISSAANAPAADVVVPSASAPTIQAAIDSVQEGKKKDGLLVVAVAPGIYRENLVVGRPVVLRGAGAGKTFVQGDGSAGAIRLTAASAAVHGLTAVGGSVGFQVDAASAKISDARAWRNLGAGVAVSGTATSVVGLTSTDNGGAGVALQGAASGFACSASRFTDNGLAGADLGSSQSAAIDSSLFDRNAAGGVAAGAAAGASLTSSQAVINILSGVTLLGAAGTELRGNLLAGNDDDGLTMDQTVGSLITQNAFLSNKGDGLFLRRSTNDDFASDAGVQAPIGDNVASGNRKNDVEIRTK